MPNKLKLAMYWGAGCGGCDVATLDIEDKILEVDKAAEIVLWPLASDHKVKDVEEMEDDSIDVCFYNGAIRNSENHEMAELLRKKSKVLVSFGACAIDGGIPGLANFFSKDEILNRVYIESESTENKNKVIPQTKFESPEGELEIPEFYDWVYTLEDVVDVDYYLPGCPPTPDNIWMAIEAIVSGNLPPKGSVITDTEKTLCDVCERKKEEKKITEFKRPFEVEEIDREKCLIEQGLVCCGPVTRAGCGVLCPNANMGCRGCYGTTEHVMDQGAKLVGAIASTIESSDPEEVKKISDMLLDPAGTFYRFTLANSMLRGKRRREKIS